MTASLASFAHQPGHTSYAASKAGVEALANSLRIEVAHQGVDVGTIHPGWISTPMVTSKEANEPAYRRLREALRPPFDSSTPVEAIVPDVGRAASSAAPPRICTPRTGWIAHALRSVSATRPPSRATCARPRPRSGRSTRISSGTIDRSHALRSSCMRNYFC